MLQIRHESDYALRNAPAYEPKPCDCGGEKSTLTALAELLRRGDELVKAIDGGKNLAIPNVDFKVGLVMVRHQLIEDKDE